MDRWIINAPRWLMLTALVYAPWAYGSTRDWALTGLHGLLGAVVLLWFVSYLLQQRWPEVHPVMAVSVAGLMLHGWFMVLNAKYDYDPLVQEFVPLTPLIAWAPGSLHRALSMENAIQVSLMLCSLFAIADMVQSSTWRRRLLWTMGLTGLSIVILGLAQRFTHAPGIFWAKEGLGENFFATWRNHTNAGTFMNIVWPVMAGLAVIAFLREARLWKKTLWCVATILSLTAMMVNTSRAAAALAVLLALTWGGWLMWQFFRGRFTGMSPTAALSTGIVLVVLVGGMAALVGLDSSLRRWKQFDNQLTGDNSRLLAAQVCLKMIPEAGPMGFGPGTFQTAFPYFTHDFDKQLRGKWIFAHQDYLQTLTEWGYVGSAGWATLIFGGVFSSVRRAFRHRRHLSDSARALHFTILTALAGVLLHALVDFPLQIASIQLNVIALLGMLWSSKSWLHNSKKHVPGRREVKPVEELACAA